MNLILIVNEKGMIILFKFTVPDNKKIRVIINSDAKNEADDQFAIVHALLTPKFIIKGLIGAHFGCRHTNDSMEKSYYECARILKIMNMSEKVKVIRGAKSAVKSKNDFEYSEGARLIVEEALSEDVCPLFVIFLGPITDLACAYLKEPQIAGRFTAIWIGGGQYPGGGSEFNLSNDINAANIVFSSLIDLWQVPVDAYAQMMISLTELQTKVAPCSKIGEYLFQQLVEFNNQASDYPDWPLGESWCLGDSAAIGLMMDPHFCKYKLRLAPFIDRNMNYHYEENSREIRVYDSIDSRFVLEDFFAKLRVFTDSTRE